MEIIGKLYEILTSKSNINDSGINSYDFGQLDDDFDDMDIWNDKMRGSEPVNFRKWWIEDHSWKDKYSFIKRQLIPFEILEKINYVQIFKENNLSGTIELDERNYDYVVINKYKDSKEEYIAIIAFNQPINKLPIETEYKVVFDSRLSFKTAMFYEPIFGYVDGGVFLDKVIRAFDNLEFNYISSILSNNLFKMLSQYFVFTLCDRCLSNYYDKGDFEPFTDEGDVALISNDKTEWILTIYNKTIAYSLVEVLSHKKMNENLKIIYFCPGSIYDTRWSSTGENNRIEVMSINEFYNSINTPKSIDAEKKIVYLRSLANLTNLDKQKIIELISADISAQANISKNILWDAVCVISDNYSRVLKDTNEWFHYLCAANVVNEYAKTEEEKKDKILYYINELFLKKIFDYLDDYYGFEDQIIDVNIKKQNKSVILVVSQEIENTNYQFVFSEISQNNAKTLLDYGLAEIDCYDNKLQSIAQLIYIYSYCLKWQQ